MAGVLFEDIFDVKDIDPDGKKFDRGVWNVIINWSIYIYLQSCIPCSFQFMSFTWELLIT